MSSHKNKTSNSNDVIVVEEYGNNTEFGDNVESELRNLETNNTLDELIEEEIDELTEDEIDNNNNTNQNDNINIENVIINKDIDTTNDENDGDDGDNNDIDNDPGENIGDVNNDDIGNDSDENIVNVINNEDTDNEDIDACVNDNIDVDFKNNERNDNGDNYDEDVDFKNNEGNYNGDNYDGDIDHNYEFGNSNLDENDTFSKKKRGIPKTILANQKKYLEVLEKQQKMINHKKDKNKNQSKGKKNIKDETIKKNTSIVPEGMRRVIVAGKVKYIPIVNNTKNEIDNFQINNDSDANMEIPIFKKQSKRSKLSKPTNQKSNKNDTSVPKNNISKLTNKLPTVTNIQKEISPSSILHSDTKINTIAPFPKNISDPNLSYNDPMTKIKKIPTSISKKMEIHKVTMAKQTNTHNKKTTSGKKIPSKYAKQIENDVKKQTVKNIKNFSDLRKIRAIQDISTDCNVDTNRASIIELRKLKVEQRKKDQNEIRKRSDANKRESAIQEILKNDKMSKFAKTVAIKNLSVNSRNRNRILSHHANV